MSKAHATTKGDFTPFVIEGVSRLTTTEARALFSEVVNRSAFGKERVVLTRRGKDIVAVVPVEDLALIEALEERIDVDEAREALTEAKRKGTIPFAVIKKDLGL